MVVYLTRSGMPSQSVRQKFSSFRVGEESGVMQWILKKWIWHYGLDVPGWGQGRLVVFVKTVMNLPVLYKREDCSSESDWIFTRFNYTYSKYWPICSVLSIIWSDGGQGVHGKFGIRNNSICILQLPFVFVFVPNCLDSNGILPSNLICRFPFLNFFS